MLLCKLSVFFVVNTVDLLSLLINPTLAIDGVMKNDGGGETKTEPCCFYESRICWILQVVCLIALNV